MPEVVECLGSQDDQAGVNLGGDELVDRPGEGVDGPTEMALAGVQETSEELSAGQPGPVPGALEIGAGGVERRGGFGFLIQTHLGNRDRSVGLTELVQGAQLVLSLQRGRRSAQRGGRVGPRQQLNLVGGDVGEPDHSARTLVAVTGLLQGRGGGVEVQVKPVAEMHQPDNVALKFLLVRATRVQDLAAERESRGEAALPHVDVGDPQACGVPDRAGVVAPDSVIELSGGAGVPGDATGMRRGDGQPGIGRPVEIGP